MTDHLRDEHESLQRAVQQSRKAFAAGPASPFVKAMQDTMDEYLRMRKEGVSREDAVKGIEAVLREVWPKPTTKFPPACDGCEGTGWHRRTCWHEQRCGRLRCQQLHPAWEHFYVVPCHCTDGDRFRPRAVESDDEIAAMSRTETRKPKPRGFTRWNP